LPKAIWKHATVTESKFSSLCKDQVYDIMFDNPDMTETDYFIMRNCIHNETVGLHNRYLKSSPNDVTFDDKVVGEILDELAKLMKPHYDGPLTLSEFMANKKGKLANRYKNAVIDVKDNGFDIKRHSKITAFVKNEIYSEKKPPRMIMGRDPRLN